MFGIMWNGDLLLTNTDLNYPCHYVLVLYKKVGSFLSFNNLYSSLLNCMCDETL
jgi:hypothetical protein